MADNWQETVLTHIGDYLDLEVEGIYLCSDGGEVSIVCVDRLLEAQAKIAYQKGGEDKRAECQKRVEGIFQDLEDMQLLKNHNHKKGESKLIACAKCTYDWFKEASLKEGINK